MAFPTIKFKKCGCGGDFYPSGNKYVCVRCGAIVPIKSGIDVQRAFGEGRPASSQGKMPPVSDNIPPDLQDDFYARRR